MKTYAERLEWAMTCAGLNPRTDQSELARRVGGGCTPQNIQYLLDHNRNAKSSKYTPRLAQVLECDVNWLAYANGKRPIPRNGSPIQHELLNIDAPNKRHAEDIFGESPVGRQPNIGDTGREPFDQNVAPAPTEVRRIPIISYVQAGMMTEAFDPFVMGDGFETITTDLNLSGSAFGLIIKGTSMEPEFKAGDKVIIDPAVSPQPGDFVVAKNTDEEATFKKYRPRGTNERGDMEFELVPLNDDFPTLHSERDHLHVIGVMVEHRKYRRR
jgi:SOS-response transcriptional repressor LexA